MDEAYILFELLHILPVVIPKTLFLGSINVVFFWIKYINKYTFFTCELVYIHTYIHIHIWYYENC